MSRDSEGCKSLVVRAGQCLDGDMPKRTAKSGRGGALEKMCRH